MMRELFLDFLQFFKAEPQLIIAVGSISAAAFVVTLLAVPILLVRIPHDYFTRRRSSTQKARHPALRRLLRILRNISGVLLCVAGLAMLVLPGQGILTIFIALTLLDFPGKRRIEVATLRIEKVHRAVNHLRQKYGHSPIELPTEDEKHSYREE